MARQFDGCIIDVDPDLRNIFCRLKCREGAIELSSVRHTDVRWTEFNGQVVMRKTRQKTTLKSDDGELEIFDAPVR